jgi:hypothetical protein
MRNSSTCLPIYSSARLDQARRDTRRDSAIARLLPVSSVEHIYLPLLVYDQDGDLLAAPRWATRRGSAATRRRSRHAAERYSTVNSTEAIEV